MTQSENTKERLAGTQFGKLPNISRKQELIPFTLINGYAWTLTVYHFMKYFDTPREKFSYYINNWYH